MKMSSHTGKKLALQIFIAISAFALAPQSWAQYVWLDDKGVKQFSDQPPPSSVPPNRILKGPGIKKAATPANATPNYATPSGEDHHDAAASASASAPSAPNETKAKAPPSLAERNAEFQKRKAEQAEKEKKAADEAERGDTRKKQCDKLQSYLRSIENSGRVTHTNKNGEREFLSEQQLEKEKQEVRKQLENCK